MNRAYSILTVKAVEEEQRIIRGIATTPSPDRVGDIVEPMGVQFKNPMPLLWQHRADKPVGTVTFDKPTKDGITFEAKLAKIDEPGTLKDRIDEAWQSVKAGLVSAVSIGFRALEYSFMDTGGIRFTESEVMELSLVTIPANAEATISQIKSIDAPMLAASGKESRANDRPKPPGAAGRTKTVNLSPQKGTAMKTIAEQIAALEASRQAKSARMADVMQKSVDEGRSTDASEQEEFDTLSAEVDAIDADLKRFRALEKAQATSAKPVNKVETEKAGAEARNPAQVKVKQKLQPGIGFARLARIKALAKLDVVNPLELAKSLYGEDSDVVGVLKAAVSAGASTTWAANLIGDETSIFADFIEFLRPQTILGRFGNGGIPSLRRVPFRTPLIGQTGGGSGYWVGEGKAKPLTAFDFSRTTLEPLKVANIAVVTEEVLRDSSPSSDGIVRDSLVAALRERLDTDFIDPAKAASAGVSPASITNGISAIASSGTDADAVRADIKALFQTFIDANNAPTSGVWIMSATMALALSLMTNALGQPEFPGITMNGGTLFGLPVITSEYVPTITGGSYVALVNAQDIYEADEGGIMVDMSREASLQMDNAPTMTSDSPTGTSVVSLWQTNSVGFRAERTINWARRRTSAVALLSGVAWG
ncbi:phage major capsid protein [Sinorhizobium fredii]|uniref:phage major capsid protein n=1 Tax=Rhizobium fredii TaxID=380 RepID=UPI0004BAA41C|nr:phage major capsid protein [Sinorhizobium fredii]ASY68883.1 Phage capsid and scaffold [Sinorhizobium fredii CCBAU 83666]